MHNEDKIKRILFRYEFVCLAFAFCFVVSSFALVRTSLARREFYLDQCSKIAWITRSVPAGRGAILDRDGTPLAWTERKYDLFLIDDPRNPELLGILSERIGINLSILDSSSGLIKRNLSPDELLKIGQLAPSLKARTSVRVRFERNTVAYPEITNLLGSVPDADSTGSGLEALHDERLRGKDGAFTVMLDRNRQWIPKSFKWLKSYQRGEDIVLHLTLEMMRRENVTEDAKK